MSAPVVVTIPHQLGRSEARRRIDEGSDRLTSQLGTVGRVSRRWNDDIMTFSAEAVGQQITGRIEVADTEVRLEIKLPGLLGLLADKVRGRLQKEGSVLLEGPDSRKT